DLTVKNGEVRPKGNIFVTDGSESLVDDVVNASEKGKKVILDTSSMPQEKELLIAGIITERLFTRYKGYKEKGELKDKPTVSVVIEEAPRVLGDRAGRNVFHQIAREGRKFRVGLIAITQLSSMIPREILANMNTKIILGNEMKSERDAIIGSAAQDLSKDSKNIASLDKGEAIVSSIFTKFAVPIKIDFFDDVVEESEDENSNKKLEFFG
ncbi:MAG: ATP-binding protein, partial [Thermoplasmatota archaeon]